MHWFAYNSRVGLRTTTPEAILTPYRRPGPHDLLHAHGLGCPPQQTSLSPAEGWAPGAVKYNDRLPYIFLMGDRDKEIG